MIGKIHDLKSWPEWFAPLKDGTKTFELRRNDRNFQVGDVLHLLEYEPGDHPDGATGRYTGRYCYRVVTYVMHGLGSVGAIEPLKGLDRNYAILALAPWELQPGSHPQQEDVG
jgi:hypothetical protein